MNTQTTIAQPTAEKKKRRSSEMAEDSSSRLVFAIALLSLFSAGLSIDDKCAACTAIAVSDQSSFLFFSFQKFVLLYCFYTIYFASLFFN